MNWYVNRLKEQKYNVKKWLLEDIIRLFGITAGLRDEDSNLNQKQILNFLEKDDKHREKERQKKLYPVYPKMPTEKELKKEYERDKRLYVKQLKEAEFDQEAIFNCEKEINNLQTNLKDCKVDLLITMLFEAKRFLDLAKHDIEWKISYYTRLLSEASSFGKYRARRIGTINSLRTKIKQEQEKAKEKIVPKYNSRAEDYKNIISLIMEA